MYKLAWAKFTSLSTVKKTLAACSLSILGICLRRPEIILHPQFWAEDFAVFYRDAYLYGISSLTHSYSGLLQTFPRLTSLLLIHFPLNLGPLLFNFVAILSMVLPIFILWSDKSLLKSIGESKKLILTLLILLMPGIGEIFGIFTNSIWYLAIASILVLIRTDIQSVKKWRYFDYALLLVAGLTGPFCGALAIAAAFLLIKIPKRSRIITIKAIIVTICTLVQLGVYLNAPNQRTDSIVHQRHAIIQHYNKPIEITGMRFFMLPILGEHAMTRDLEVSPQSYALGIIVLLITVAAFIKSSLEVRALILFCAVLYAISFLRAQTVSILQFWDILQFNDFGGRYFFVPMFGWIVALLSLTNLQSKTLGKFAASIIALYLIFFPFSFGISKLKDTNFQNEAKAFKVLPKGDKYCFHVNPDSTWNTCLKKK